MDDAQFFVIMAMLFDIKGNKYVTWWFFALAILSSDFFAGFMRGLGLTW